MKTLKKPVFAFLGGVIMMSLLFPLKGFADGGMIIPANDHWDLLDQESQKAFISYRDGFENLILAVDLGKADEGAVWIFPVPAEPGKVAIDVLNNIPSLNGEEVIKKARYNIGEVSQALRATQVYPIFLGTLGYYGGPFSEIDNLVGVRSGGDAAFHDVSIYEHLEKEGIITEVITAKDANALYNYLSGKGPKIEKGTYSMFDYYIGKNYTFVVSWMAPQIIFFQEKEDKIKEIISILGISEETAYYNAKEKLSKLENSQLDEIKNEIRNLSEEEFEKYKKNWEEMIKPFIPDYRLPTQRQRGVFITFPTNKVYYPLLPTSIYESKRIPVSIRVLDYVKPEIYKDIKPYTKVKYYWQNYGLGNELENFYSGEKIGYTKIDINIPSKYFTDDLWMEIETPAVVTIAGFFSRYPVIDYFLAAIFWSMLAGMIAGSIVFKKSRTIKRYALLGFLNVFSIIGLVVGTIFTKTKKLGEEQEEKIKKYQTEIKKMGLGIRIIPIDTKRKVLFIFLFSVVFVILTLIRQGLLTLMLPA